MLFSDQRLVLIWVGEFAPAPLQKAAHALAERLKAAQPSLAVVAAREAEEPAALWEAMSVPDADTASRAASEYATEGTPDKPLRSHIAAAVRHAAEWRCLGDG